MVTFPFGGSADPELLTVPAAKPKRVRESGGKKAKKTNTGKKRKPKAKSKPKTKAKRKPAKKTKTKKKTAVKARNGGPVRSERLDMRITKADKAKLSAKARKLKIPITEVVLRAIAKVK